MIEKSLIKPSVKDAPAKDDTPSGPPARKFPSRTPGGSRKGGKRKKK